MSMENTNQEEVLEETEQEELVEAPEQEEEKEQSEKILAEKSKAKVKEDDDEDEDEDDEGDDDSDDDDEEEESVKKEEVKIPPTKAGMIKALFDKVNGLKKEEVSAKWKDLMGVAEAEDLGGETPQDATPFGDTGKIGKKKKKIKISMPEINVKEDIDALVEGEELSDCTKRFLSCNRSRYCRRSFCSWRFR